MTWTLRTSCLALVVTTAACATSKPPPPPPKAPIAEAPREAPPEEDEVEEPSEPFPPAKQGAAWTVVDWTMTDKEAAEALKTVNLTPARIIDPRIGHVVSLEVTSAQQGWKASIAFDEATNKVKSVVVRGDPVTVEAAREAHARLEKRFGAPKMSKVHRSRQWGTKAVEIEGGQAGQGAWRITQSLMREGKAKGQVEWPSLNLTWGMSASAVTAAMKSSGFTTEKVAPATTAVAGAKGSKKGRSKAKTLHTTKPPLPAGSPKGSKVIELAFKKGEERVLVSLVDKTGLFKVGVGQDVADQKTAEQKASLAAKGLGTALSEAEMETTEWHDAASDVKLTITGFQGQRIVVETYRDPAQPEDQGAAWVTR